MTREKGFALGRFMLVITAVSSRAIAPFLIVDAIPGPNAVTPTARRCLRARLLDLPSKFGHDFEKAFAFARNRSAMRPGTARTAGRRPFRATLRTQISPEPAAMASPRRNLRSRMVQAADGSASCQISPKDFDATIRLNLIALTAAEFVMIYFHFKLARRPEVS